MSENKSSELKSLFLVNMPTNALLLISSGKSSSITEITRFLAGTYSHISEVVRQFKKSGLVVFEWKGRTKHILLTDKGRELAKRLQSVSDLF